MKKNLLVNALILLLPRIIQNRSFFDGMSEEGMRGSKRVTEKEL